MDENRLVLALGLFFCRAVSAFNGVMPTVFSPSVKISRCLLAAGEVSRVRPAASMASPSGVELSGVGSAASQPRVALTSRGRRARASRGWST